jgi:hypothetical protein
MKSKITFLLLAIVALLPTVISSATPNYAGTRLLDFEPETLPGFRAGLLWYKPLQNDSLSGTYSYHPNFQLSQLAYSNGVTGTFSEGTKGISRPRQLTHKKGGITLFDTGKYEYDGAGNIYKIGADSYTYDAANRLKYGTVTQAGSRWETYLYDDFDNITAGQKENSTLIPFNVNSATNRYTGDFGDIQYDSTGNISQLGAPNWIMKWDVFDMQTQFTSVVAPQSDHLYAYGPGDYRLVTLDTSTQEITYHFRDRNGARQWWCQPP